MIETPVQISGPGLITGQPIKVHLSAAPQGCGIIFEVEGTEIPAHPHSLLEADRGVTLGCPGHTISIVEHFLAACSMLHVTDLKVQVWGGPELPLLDGSAVGWLPLLEPFRPNLSLPLPVPLSRPVYYQDPKHPQIEIYALPSSALKLSYLVDFPHPDLSQRWYSWSAQEGPLVSAIAPARTFGFVSELPILQARGLAKGVSLENTLGLTDDGGYTSPLKLPNEPIRHKILDLIGDLMLCGIPIQTLQAHLVVHWGGHAAHLAFGGQLKQALSVNS